MLGANAPRADTRAPLWHIGAMINDVKLTAITRADIESYAREAKEFAPKLSRFIVKNRAHVGAVYLVLDFLMRDIEKNHPEVKGLKPKEPTTATAANLVYEEVRTERNDIQSKKTKKKSWTWLTR